MKAIIISDSDARALLDLDKHEARVLLEAVKLANSTVKSTKGPAECSLILLVAGMLVHEIAENRLSPLDVYIDNAKYILINKYTLKNEI